MVRRLANTVHTDRAWRVHEIADDFHVEDVWAVRAPGAGPDDFHTMLAAIQQYEASRTDPALLRFLLAVRWKLGALLGVDDRKSGVGARVHSLRDRLPSDLREGSFGSDRGLAPLVPVYELADECALEMANKTVHAVMHLGWAPDAKGGHELRMAVLVEPNGLVGRCYMAAIAPFRYSLVLPAFLRRWERAWLEARSVTDSSVPVGAMRCAVGTGEVGSAVLAWTSLSTVDYVDHFTLGTDEQATPEEWARAMFGDVPGASARLIWQGLLALRIAPKPSPDRVAGWRIAGRGENWIRLEAAGGLLSGNLVVHAADGAVSLATFLRYNRGFGRIWWPPLSAVHRRLTPGLLRDAAARIRARRGATVR